MKAKHNDMNTEGGLASVLYMKCTEKVDKIDNVFGGARLTWSIPEDVDYSNMKEEEDVVPEVDDWFGS